MKNGLTKMQKEFADEYMKTGNATEASPDVDGIKNDSTRNKT